MSYYHLTINERIVIAEGLEKGLSQTEISKFLERRPSQLVRRSIRNRNPETGKYNPALTHEMAHKR